MFPRCFRQSPPRSRLWWEAVRSPPSTPPTPRAPRERFLAFSGAWDIWRLWPTALRRPRSPAPARGVKSAFFWESLQPRAKGHSASRVAGEARGLKARFLESGYAALKGRSSTNTLSRPLCLDLFTNSSVWDGHGAPSLPSTAESATTRGAPATEIPRIPENRSASSSHPYRFRYATADTGFARGPGDGPWWRSRENAA